MAVLDADAYVQDRLNQQLTWLSKASRSNKRTILRLRILKVLLGTGITIFSPFVTRWGWGPWRSPLREVASPCPVPCWP
jgi:hypothetical protein